MKRRNWTWLHLWTFVVVLKKKKQARDANQCWLVIELWPNYYQSKSLKTDTKKSKKHPKIKFLIFQLFTKMYTLPINQLFCIDKLCDPQKKFKKDQSCATVIFKKQSPANFSSSLWPCSSPLTNPLHHYRCWIVVQCLQPKRFFLGPLWFSLPSHLTICVVCLLQQ